MDETPPTEVPGSPDYAREESRAHQLDRNWGELVQELRVIGTGIQILFAFLLSIAFQARFAQTNTFQQDVYLATMLASGLAAALFIAPVALHRFLFQFGVKDELVRLTNRVAIAGLAVLSLALVGAVLLVCDWVGGPAFGWASAGGAVIVLGGSWFVGPAILRHRARMEAAGGEADDRSSAYPGGSL
jgi:hypothetical protein